MSRETLGSQRPALSSLNTHAGGLACFFRFTETLSAQMLSSTFPFWFQFQKYLQHSRYLGHGFFFGQILTLHNPLLYFQCLRNLPTETNGFGEVSLGETGHLSTNVSCGLETLMSSGPVSSVPWVEGLTKKETGNDCQPFLGTKESCVAIVFLIFFFCVP